MNAEIKIYVACLAAYNSGILHGEWIDATQDASDIQAAVQAMLAKSPEPGAEEWAIHDFDGFGGIQIGESTSFETVSALAKAINEHGELFAKFYAHQCTDDVDQAVSDFEEKNRGAFDSLADYVQNYWEECGDWKEEGDWWHPSKYVDWERMGRDLETSGDVFTIELDGEVHVFDNH